MKNPIVVILVFIGVFVCGAVVGGALTFRFSNVLVEERAADRFVFRHWRELGEQLELTEAQQAQVAPIIKRAIEDRQAVYKQSQGIFERMFAELDALLTPEQRAQYKEYRSTQRERDRQWQRWAREQRERRGDAPPVGPDGKPLPPPPLSERRERERRSERPERRESAPREPEPKSPESALPSGSGGGDAEQL